MIYVRVSVCVRMTEQQTELLDTNEYRSVIFFSSSRKEREREQRDYISNFTHIVF